MGYGDLTLDARSSLQEIARMAYGSGLFEGTSGGKGRMGVLFDESGNARVVKFNTHLGERLFGDKQDDEMLLGSNNLRTVLKSIADSAGLPPDARNDIYKKLGIDGTTGEVVAKGLLSRRDVASVVSMIGGDQVWTDAWSSKNKADYVSAEQTQLKDIAPTVNNADSANLRTIGKFAQLTEKGVRNLVGNVRGGLNERQKDLLARVLNEQTIGELVSSGVLNGCSPSRIESRLLAWAKKELGGNDTPSIQELRKSCVAALTTKGEIVISGRFLTDAALDAFGMTLANLNEDIGEMARRFKLNEVEQQIVSRIVTAFLAARLEGPNPMLGPKDLRAVRAAIADGTFDGCRIGLLNIGKDQVLPPGTSYSSELTRMSNADCENVAYLFAKCDAGEPDVSGRFGPSSSEVRVLKDQSASLLRLREEKGFVTLDDIHMKLLHESIEPALANIRNNPVVQELFEMLRSDVKFARQMCETLAGDPNFKNLLGKVNFCKWLVDLKKDPSVTNPLPFGRFVIAPGKIEQLKTLMLADLRSNLSQPVKKNTTSVIYNDLKRNFSIVYMDKGEKKTLNFKNSTSGQDEDKENMKEIENGLKVAFGNNANFIKMAKKFLHQGAISFVQMPEFANAFGIAPGCQLVMGGSGDGTEDTSFTITANGVGRYKISTSMSTRLDVLTTAEERSIHFGDTADGAPLIRMDYSFDLVLTEGKDSFDIANLTIDTENATLELPGISSDEEEWLPLWNDDLRE